MATYISMLRGINVSGHKKILMADLRALYENIGFKNVRTYIQSGNVVFDASARSNRENLVKKIKSAISKKYGFDVPIIIRTAPELQIALDKNPFLKVDDIDPKRIAVAFLAEHPVKENLDKLNGYHFPPDEFIVIGQECYLHCPVSFATSKLSNNFIEKKLKVTATSRNLRTINKLIELATI